MTDIVEATRRVETARKPQKMLIADDDPAVVGLLSSRFVKMGFAVETAANGIQLLIKARQNHPDIIIVDVNMPELDGISACARLLNPGGKPVDVIVITASSDPDTSDRCESLGLFYGNKKHDFWKSIEEAMFEICPDMADKIVGLEEKAKNATVQERPRVLLIDDDPSIQHFLASRLGKFGIETLYASDAMHGFRIASRSRPSAIIADNYMPNGDAKYLLSRLRSSPATENIPVIVISGQKLDATTEHNLRREVSGKPGAAHIFLKSFDTSELFDALRKYCKLS